MEASSFCAFTLRRPARAPALREQRGSTVDRNAGDAALLVGPAIVGQRCVLARMQRVERFTWFNFQARRGRLRQAAETAVPRRPRISGADDERRGGEKDRNSKGNRPNQTRI